MNGDSFEDFANRKGRSLSFSHTRFHRHNSSSEEEESPTRYFPNEYDDEFSRDSLSEFSNVTLNDQEGRGHRRETHDDLSSITRKRTFSSSDPHSTDDANGSKSEKRTATKICRVCGDKAYSYNFSVVTCESCKAFFRRNANKDKDIRCPFNDNCDINIVSRRFCQKCRLAKCFKVGMKKEWIMSEEARREKKQRIQDNRERRMAEKAQEEMMLQQKQMTIPSQINGSSLDSTSAQIIANGIQLTSPSEAIVQPQLAQNLASLNPGILPSLPQAATITTIIPSEPQNVMQQVIQQAQQVQNAQLLAQVAMQTQSDPIASIQQAAQMASIGSTGVPTQPNSIVAAANLSHLAQVIQNQSDSMASIGTTSISATNENSAVDSYQSACLAPNVVAAAANLNANLNHLAQVAAMQNQTDSIVSIQSPTTTASMVNLNNLAHAAAQIQQNLANQQIQQQISANLAAQRIEASQNLADQQQLAAAVAVAAISNQTPIQLPSIIPPPQNSAPLSSVPLAPLVEPVIQAVNPNNEMIAVRKDVLMNIVQENIENRHQQLQQQINTPPVKCKCICQCGRYPSDSVIVDHVMSDMLQGANNNISPPILNQQPIVESMDCSSRHDVDCCLLNEDDKMALGELEQADKIFWAADPTSFDTNASDAALRKVIRMVTSLNTFNKLSRADQSNLLRHGCPSHFVIRQAMGNLIENQQSLMVVQFHNSLREEWKINHQLMLLLSIMVIFDPDTPNLENKAQVEQTCSRLKSILKRMLYTFYMDSQKTTIEFDDLIAKLNVLQSLNNAPIQQAQNGADSHRFWSSEILEPLLSRELFEPNIIITPNVVNTISSMT